MSIHLADHHPMQKPRKKIGKSHTLSASLNVRLEKGATVSELSALASTSLDTFQTHVKKCNPHSSSSCILIYGLAFLSNFLDFPKEDILDMEQSITDLSWDTAWMRVVNGEMTVQP